MRPTVTLLATTLSSFIATAQFGPIQFAFTSELMYPSRMMSGDVDGDGATDAVLYNASSGSIYDYTLCWYRNLGGGAFAPKQVMFTGWIDSGVQLRIRDMDGDGDGDVTMGGNWYANNGTG